MTELTTPTGISTGLIAVEIPVDAKDFCESETGGFVYFHGQSIGNFGSPINLKYDSHSILGTVTEAEISFNVEPYVENRYSFDFSCVMYKDYMQEGLHKFDAESSLRSLLAFNGLHFVNPYGNDPLRQEFYNFTLEQWRTAEDKIVNKLLIIKKVQ